MTFNQTYIMLTSRHASHSHINYFTRQSLTSIGLATGHIFDGWTSTRIHSNIQSTRYPLIHSPESNPPSPVDEAGEKTDETVRSQLNYIHNQKNNEKHIWTINIIRPTNNKDSITQTVFSAEKNTNTCSTWIIVKYNTLSQGERAHKSSIFLISSWIDY